MVSLPPAALPDDAVVPGALHLVATPIGHRADVTLRALAVLAQASLVLCEDTRHTGPLLAHYGIATPTASLHAHNEARSIEGVLARLAAGEAVALVSDAGTPLLSDPGERLVAAVIAAGHRVVPVPGPSALLAALTGAGLPALPVTMAGFLPRKGRERRDMIAQLAALPHTVVVYEAPPRLAATLAELANAAGDPRPACVARELTKHFEEFRRGTLAELAAYYADHPPRGEIVIVMAGASVETPTEEQLREAAHALRARGLTSRDVVAALVAEHGARRNVAWRLAHQADVPVGTGRTDA